MYVYIYIYIYTHTYVVYVEISPSEMVDHGRKTKLKNEKIQKQYC